MRHTTIILTFLLAVSGIQAQIQKGYVKTQGRPDRPGKPLAGVAIRWKGSVNAVISGTDGLFTVPFTNKNNGEAIYLVSAKKNGYELLDPEQKLKRPFIFSKEVPVEIVMASTVELETNKRIFQQKATHRAEIKYQDELTKLNIKKKESQLTLEEYQQQVQELQDTYEKYMNLVEVMAERYARTDYDHLDSIGRVINLCMENGELEKADSLIHSVFDPNTVLERRTTEKKALDERNQAIQAYINKAIADMKTLVKDSNYAKRVIFLCDELGSKYLMQGQTDKAKDAYIQSLSIRRLVYGEKSKEVKIIKQKLEEIK